MRAPERLIGAWKGPSGIVIPRFVVILLGVDLALALGYLAYYLLGRPFDPLARFIDLDGEANLPTWYASIQWFCVSAALWVFAERQFVRPQIRSWLLFLLPAVFLAFSLDEVAGIHEWLGGHSDAVMPNGTRADSPFSKTGVYFIVIGVPFVILLVGLIAAVGPYLARFPRAFALFSVGMATFVTGAIALDVLSNYVTADSLPGVAQVTIEELTEMIGATVVLWGACELVRGDA
jgi:hypothetical protein